ncbi:MAG: DUF3536 domain-containing protein, partial [Nitrospinales bacterium]
LEVLAEQEIQFVILAPHQARGVRPLGGGKWQNVSQGKIDTTQPYTLCLPSGSVISLFFYHGAISHAVAFGDILNSGETFAHRLFGAFSENSAAPQLVHIASDGETYGHHHKFGDMALAAALRCVQSTPGVQLANYGEFLEKHPPAYEVKLFEETSWSCAHGVERWRGDCGCHTGGGPGWNQSWRRPLRVALEWLRDALGLAFEKKARRFLNDPWAARNDYVDLVLDRSPENVERFFERNARRTLTQTEKTAVLKLMELQRHAMTMFTSCGWFFAEISGIETVQIIQYAGRAIQLFRQIFGEGLEPRFLELLERAKSNLPDIGNGRRIYEKSVTSGKVDLPKLCAHLAVNSLFEELPAKRGFYGCRVEFEDFQPCGSGKARLALGRAKLTSEVVLESGVFAFGFLHRGDYNLTGHVREVNDLKNYRLMAEEVQRAFQKGDFAKTIQTLERHLGSPAYTLKSLFRDEQNKILERIMDSALVECEPVYRKLYEYYAPLIRFLKVQDIAPPKLLSTAFELVLNFGLRHACDGEAPDLERISKILEEAEIDGVSLDAAAFELRLGRGIERMARRFLASPGDLPLLQTLKRAIDLTAASPFRVDLWKAQNIFYEMLENIFPAFEEQAEKGNETAKIWMVCFLACAEALSVRVAREDIT